MKAQPARRIFLKRAAAAASAYSLSGLTRFDLFAARKENGFRSLFDGKTLNGWTRQPRTLQHPSLGKWIVEDGMIVGGQATPGLGSYLVSDETFADFDLEIDAWPDWPADTGIYVRTVPQGNVGIQVLLDYRPHGGIGGYYGNALGKFHAWDYGFTAEKDKNGRLVRLIPEEPQEHEGNHKVSLDYAAPVQEFLRVWRLNTWNRFRIRSVGALPVLTTWINGEKMCELDTAKMQAPEWDPQAALKKIGRAGHIALEVHSSGGNDWMKDRWAPGAVCRWRNISIRTL